MGHGMQHGTYVGPRRKFKGKTALLQERRPMPGWILVQFDDMKLRHRGLSMAHGWHLVRSVHFVRDQPPRDWATDPVYRNDTDWHVGTMTPTMVMSFPRIVHPGQMFAFDLETRTPDPNVHLGLLLVDGKPVGKVHNFQLEYYNSLARRKS